MPCTSDIQPIVEACLTQAGYILMHLSVENLGMQETFFFFKCLVIRQTDLEVRFPASVEDFKGK